MKYQDAPFYETLDFETIFGYTWMLYKRHFGWLFFYSFLGIILLQALMYSMFSDTLSQLFKFAQDPQGPVGDIAGNMFLLFTVFFVIYSLLYLFLFYFVITKSLTPEKSHLTIFTEAVRQYYLSYLLLMIIIFMIFFFGILFGVFMFVIGAFFAAVFLGTVFFPSTPVLIVEKESPLKVIARCFRLVLKDFWRIMGFILVFYVIIILFSMIFSAVSMAPYAGKFIHAITGSPDTEILSGTSGMFMPGQNPWYIVLNSLFNALLLPLTPIFSTLVYFHLKYNEDQLNPVFKEMQQ